MFAPDVTRARALDRAVHLSLAQSLAHVADRCGGAVEADFGGVRTLVQQMEAGRTYGAELFCVYHDLVRAILDDDLVEAARLFEDVARINCDDGGQRILPLAQASRPEAYVRMLVAESGLDFGLVSPEPDVFAAFEARCRRGLDLLGRAAPELHDEIAVLVREIVGVVSDPSRPISFDGGSCPQLWGAMALNAHTPHSDVEMADVLAHESAHCLLFGLAKDDLLLENGEDELYASPLRSDPRPLLGIYHATFVSARMHYAMDRILSSGVLDRAGDREAAARAREASRRNFFAGLEVVREHARLTELGAELMTAAAASVQGPAKAATGPSDGLVLAR